MLQEMAGLGFEWVELSHGIRITLVPGILRALEAGAVRVASCHNFCPLPTGVTHAAPNLYVPSSRDARERDQWLRHSKRSVDFARQFGARKLVLHLGHVEFFWSNPGRKLAALAAGRSVEELRDNAAYQKQLARALRKLRGRQPVFWEHTRASIAELLPYAAAQGVTLGFENREKFEELPLDADFADFMNAFPADAAAGYWHDTGHARIKEAMGLLDHRQQLEKNAARTIGFHLHDVSADGRDHQPIGSGEIDFEMVGEFWRPEHTLVLEFSPRLTVEEIQSSKQRVEKLIAARFGA